MTVIEIDEGILQVCRKRCAEAAPINGNAVTHLTPEAGDGKQKIFCIYSVPRISPNT